MSETTIEWTCRIEHVRVFVKQLGARPGSYRDGRWTAMLPLKSKKGVNPSEWPEVLRVREFPEVRPT